MANIAQYTVVLRQTVPMGYNSLQQKQTIRLKQDSMPIEELLMHFYVSVAGSSILKVSFTLIS